MHFLASLLFLMVTIVLAVAYLLVLYLAAVGFQRLGHWYRRRYSMHRYAVPHKKLWSVFPKSKFKKIAIIVSLILSLFYVQQRVEWTGDDNANLVAKEYFVAGQVVAGVRFAAIRVLHPENPLMLPLNVLQRAIYRAGIQHLPEGDGEIGAWTDLWLLYPYNYRLRLPYFVDVKSDKPSPKMRKLLDRCWFALKKMATGTYADRQIKTDLYYRNFPALALYYQVYDGFYADRYAGSYKDILKDKALFERKQRLLDWIADLKVKWQKEKMYDEIKSKFTIVEVYRVTVELDLAQSILVGTALHGTFSCKSRFVQKTIEVSDRIMKDSPDDNIFLVYSRQGKNEYRRVRNFYRELLYSLRGAFCEYVVERMCNNDFPAETYIFISQTEYHGKWAEVFIQSAYEEELGKLKKSANDGLPSPDTQPQ